MSTALLFYQAPPLKLKNTVINHVMANHLAQFFEIEEIEVEPPKGNFQMVNQCQTITSELLGSPNYHRYQEFLQLHYAARITGMSFEQFMTGREFQRAGGYRCLARIDEKGALHGQGPTRRRI